MMAKKKSFLEVFRCFFHSSGKSDLVKQVHALNIAEVHKSPSRTEVINFLLSRVEGESRYLEIGVRNPADNFSKIIADYKVSVDPGVEFPSGDVDYKMTSDDFFKALSSDGVNRDRKPYDVIFIDGLHLATQVDRDILNSLKHLTSSGFIVLHDCNPPTEWHARDSFEYKNSPAAGAWNGTTWKAFVKWRQNPEVSCCCIDSDWGIGIISTSINFGPMYQAENQFYEFQEFHDHRKEALNLMNYDSFQDKL